MYPGPDLLGDDELNLQEDIIPAVLAEDEVDSLVHKYLSNMSTNYTNWMTTAISQEMEDWVGQEEIEIDLNNCYYTSTPVLINR